MLRPIKMPEATRRFLEESRRKQGLPRRIEDAQVLGRLAVLFTSGTEKTSDVRESL